MLKRKFPLPEEDTSLPRTIYSVWFNICVELLILAQKGWPEGSTIEKVTEFYASHGKVLSARLRKKPTGEFKVTNLKVP